MYTVKATHGEVNRPKPEFGRLTIAPANALVPLPGLRHALDCRISRMTKAAYSRIFPSRPGPRSSKRSAARRRVLEEGQAAAKKAKPASKPKPRAAPAKKRLPVREEAESTASNPVGRGLRTVIAGGGWPARP